MKTVAFVIAVTLLSACIAFAEKGVTADSGKDMCLLDNNYCTGQSYYGIVEKIARIRAALEIGSKVYSPEEVKHLEYLLEEALMVAERIDADPSQVPENKDN